jgi:hypothetical protein
MSPIKKLYEVLPPEKRIIESLKLIDIVGKTLILHGATTQKAGEVTYAKLTVSLDPSPIQFYVTANQEQITAIVAFLIEANAFPVQVKIITAGKSYSIVDPDYGVKPADQPTLPGLEQPNKEETK